MGPLTSAADILLMVPGVIQSAHDATRWRVLRVGGDTYGGVVGSVVGGVVGYDVGGLVGSVVGGELGVLPGHP